MSIRRASSEVRHTYTIIPNATINDEDLSWEALGLLVFLLSKPDHWVISPTHLVKQRGSGRQRVYKILHELEEAGYVVPSPVREGGRFAGVERVVYDVSRKREVPDEPPKKRKTRKADPLFEALVLVCGMEQERITTSARGAANRAVAELKSVGADAESIRSAADAYRIRYPDAALTPAALVKHYPSLAPKKREVPAKTAAKKACPDCEATGFVPGPDDPHVVYRCDSCGGAGHL